MAGDKRNFFPNLSFSIKQKRTLTVGTLMIQMLFYLKPNA
jgi:hypothetical protein